MDRLRARYVPEKQMSGGCIVLALTIVSETSAEVGVQRARERGQTNLLKTFKTSVFIQTITVSAA
jgi:hypothetical protein